MEDIQHAVPRVGPYASFNLSGPAPHMNTAHWAADGAGIFMMTCAQGYVPPRSHGVVRALELLGNWGRLSHACAHGHHMRGSCG